MKNNINKTAKRVDMRHVQLYHGDCLVEMLKIPDHSVDMVLCNLPYGLTKCDWDKVIPFKKLWEQYKRITKERSAIVLFGKQPFTTELIYSNLENFKYEWIWRKSKYTGFLNSHRRPMVAHENILVFYEKLPIFNPQKTQVRTDKKIQKINSHTPIYNKYKDLVREDDGFRYPCDVLYFKEDKAHYMPTQKPVALLEYLIKTYTNERAIVLDNAMGCGSTGVACIKTNRDFIGIEIDREYFQIAHKRISTYMESLMENT